MFVTRGDKRRASATLLGPERFHVLCVRGSQRVGTSLIRFPEHRAISAICKQPQKNSSGDHAFRSSRFFAPAFPLQPGATQRSSLSHIQVPLRFCRYRRKEKKKKKPKLLCLRRIEHRRQFHTCDPRKHPSRGVSFPSTSSRISPYFSARDIARARVRRQRELFSLSPFERERERERERRFFYTRGRL